MVDVPYHEAGLRMNLFPVACAQVVHDNYLVACGDIRIYNVRADEASSTGDENDHGDYSPSGIRCSPPL
jgi:hypothetical protein